MFFFSRALAHQLCQYFPRPLFHVDQRSCLAVMRRASMPRSLGTSSARHRPTSCGSAPSSRLWGLWTLSSKAAPMSARRLGAAHCESCVRRLEPSPLARTTAQARPRRERRSPRCRPRSPRSSRARSWHQSSIWASGFWGKWTLEKRCGGA